MARPAAKIRMCAGIAAIVVAGCSVSPPEAPSTNFVINIPVANDSTTIGELVAGRSSFLQINDQTGGMALHVEVPEDPQDVLGTAKVEDNLASPATAEELPPTQIGTIELEGSELPSVSITLAEIAGGQEFPAGESIPEIFDTSVDLNVDPTEFDLEDVTEVVILRAGIELEITNRLPMPLSILEITLRDRGNGNRVVGSPLLIEDVAALVGQGGTPGTKSGVLSLDGQTISGQLSIEVRVVTPDVGEVEVGDNPGLEIITSLPGLEVTSATAVIPRQVFAPDEPQIVEFPESAVLVDTAAIMMGAISITMDNQIPLEVDVELTVLDLVTRSTGQPVVFEIPLRAPGEGETTSRGEPERFDLGTVSFIPVDPTELRISYVATTRESNRAVTISADQALEVSVEVEPLVFSRVSGRMNRLTLDIPEQRRTVDIPAGLDNINIAETRVEVYVTTAVGFVADVNLVITGTNTAGVPAPDLQIPVSLAPLEPGQTERSEVIRPSPEALTAFLNHLPSEIVVNAEVFVGDGETASVIDSSNSVTVDRIVFDTSPRLAIVEDTQMEPEESLQNITFRDSEARRRISSNFQSGNVTATLENSIPLGVGVRLFVGRTEAAVFDTTSPDHVIAMPRLKKRFDGEVAANFPKNPFEARAAPIDTETGFSDGTTTTELPIELTKDEALEFILEDGDTGLLFSGVRVTLPKTQGNVEIRTTDFININAGMGVELRLNSDLVE